MKIYHDALAKEMIRRGYNHKSPYEMPDLSYLPKEEREAKVCVLRSIDDLWGRCPDCRKLLRDHPLIQPFEN